jgi:hypothetical protein
VNRIGPAQCYSHRPQRLPTMRRSDSYHRCAVDRPHQLLPTSRHLPSGLHASRMQSPSRAAESVGDSKQSSSLRSPLLASPFTFAMLQHRALPRQASPVGLRLGDLLEHRPNLGLLSEPSAAAWSRPQVTRCHLVPPLWLHHRC